MTFREAQIRDIAEIQLIRRLVHENKLSNPERITDALCKEYLIVRGKGWVCEKHNVLLGFAIADLKEDNIWALFLRPEYEGQGIGLKLHNLMLNWYFSQGKEKVWLGTSRDTRAEGFYRKQGWQEAGINGEDELKFEMTRHAWISRSRMV